VETSKKSSFYLNPTARPINNYKRAEKLEIKKQIFGKDGPLFNLSKHVLMRGQTAAEENRVHKAMPDIGGGVGGRGRDRGGAERSQDFGSVERCHPSALSVSSSSSGVKS